MGQQPKGSLGNDFATPASEQTQANTPANSQQSSLVAQRAGGEIAAESVPLRAIEAIEVGFTPMLKRMHLQVDISLAFRKPKDGGL